MNKEYDFFTISDILIDIMFDISDQELNKISVPKGTRKIIELKERDRILKQLSDKEAQSKIYGYTLSIANNSKYLGIKSVVAGKLGMDPFGIDTQNHLKTLPGVLMDFNTGYGCTDSTLILTTPDNTRTWLIQEGMSKKISFKDIDSSKLKKSKLLYITSDMIDNENRIRLVKFMIRVAKESNTRILFDLNNVKNIIKHSKTMFSLLKESDIILCALDDAFFLLNNNRPDFILKELGKFASTVALKTATNYYVNENGLMHNISKTNHNKMSSEHFAAGFIFGYLEGLSAEKSAIIGSYLASKEKLGEKIIDEVHDII